MTSEHELEEKYVHNVYDSIANHFSKTRYKPWPKVEHFINSFPIGSLMFDCGCGNGKYMHVNNNNVISIGCDRSIELLKICRTKNFEVCQCECLSLPFRDGIFDACICIAVLHHLASYERRLNAIKSLVNCIKIGGKILIYVWSFEQNKSAYVKKNKIKNDIELYDDFTKLKIHENGTEFKGHDLLVPWKTTNDLRYYHLFTDGELQEMITKISNVKLIESFYDSGNWGIIIEKF